MQQQQQLRMSATPQIQSPTSPPLSDYAIKMERELAFLRIRLGYLKQDRVELEDAVDFCTERERRILKQTRFLLDTLMQKSGLLPPNDHEDGVTIEVEVDV